MKKILNVLNAKKVLANQITLKDNVGHENENRYKCKNCKKTIKTEQKSNSAKLPMLIFMSVKSVKLMPTR